MISPADLLQARPRDLEEERRRERVLRFGLPFALLRLRNLRKATRSLESCSPSCVFHEKESSFGFGRDEGGSLAGNESAIVLSSIFSRFACGSPGSTFRSSGSLRWTLTMFEGRFSREALVRLMINGNPVCSAFFRRWRSRAPSHRKPRRNELRRRSRSPSGFAHIPTHVDPH